MKNLLFLGYCLIALICSAQAQHNLTRLSQSSYVNPAPLDLIVGKKGSIQIKRNGQGQLFDPIGQPNSSSMYNSVYMAIGNQVIASNGAAINCENYQWNKNRAVSSVSGNGSVHNPWKISVILASTRKRGYRILANYYYVNGNDWVDIELIVTTPNNNNKNIKIYHCVDTYLGGSDFGRAYVVGAAPHRLVGVQNNSSTLYQAFIVGNKQWNRFTSKKYNHVINQPRGGRNLDNRLSFNSAVDNGIGVQWILGAVKGTQPPIRYKIAFKDNVLLGTQIEEFKAKTEDRKSALLTWTTQSELNSDYCEVQYMKEGESTYKKVQHLKAADITTASKSYVYRCRHTENGRYYYRIKIVEQDGHVTYSSVQTVNIDGFNHVHKIYPVPVRSSERLYLELAAGVTNYQKITLIDFRGHEHKPKISFLSNAKLCFDLSGFKSGGYVLSVLSEGQVFNKRIIITP